MGGKQVTMKGGVRGAPAAKRAQTYLTLQHQSVLSIGDTQRSQPVLSHPQVLSLGPTFCCCNTGAVAFVWLGHTHRSKGILNLHIQWLKKRNPLVPTYQRCLFCCPPLSATLCLTEPGPGSFVSSFQIAALCSTKHFYSFALFFTVFLSSPYKSSPY